MNEYIPIISVVTALLAVIIGPFVTLHIARRQIKANVISPNRQQWINTLRDEISNCLAIMARTSSATASRLVNDEYFLICIEDLCRSESKIRLLLNPNESDHAELISRLKESSSFAWYANCKKKDSFVEDMYDLREQIIAVSQPILKREWMRVKELR